MRVDCALLCDAATVREGLLHILGGGVTRLSRPSMPGPLSVQLALRIVVHPTEAALNHEGQVFIQTDDGARVAEIGFGFGSIEDPENKMLPGEEFALPLVVPTAGIVLPKLGAYAIEVLIDKIHQVSVPFAFISGPI